VISVVIIVPVMLIILAIVLVKKYGKIPVKVAAETKKDLRLEITDKPASVPSFEVQLVYSERTRNDRRL
jgi:hypothetical protein